MSHRFGVYHRRTHLLFCCILPPLKGQIHVAEFRAAIVVIHEGRVEIRIDFTPENAKVEAFKYVI